MKETKFYPKAVEVVVGCKVAWHYYDNKEDAIEAGKIAEYNAEILEAQGYDFGFQCPGKVEAPESVYNESVYWKVTMP